MSDRFVVSARKYRPDSFKELLGQDAISVTLRRAISHHKTAHAYLFCGPRGVGKTSAARIFAKAINCLSPAADGESCSVCESCKAFEEQRSINIYELDAASNNSTEDIRRLINEVAVPPQFGRYKVYIIDEVHMLSQGAFNAFLKTLEEPPSYVVFILATTEKQKILPTILSRCQVFDFKPIPADVIVGQLTSVGEQEAIPTEQKALELIAKQADGGMRDALSLFDRIAGFGNGRVTYEQTVESLHVLSENHFFRFAELIHNNDASGVLYLLDELISKGFDAKTILVGLQEFFRKLMLACDNTTLSIAKLTEEEKESYTRLAQDLGRAFLYKALCKLAEAEKVYRTSNAKRLLVEIALLGLTSIEGSPSAQAMPTQSSTANVKATTPAPEPQSTAYNRRETQSVASTQKATAPATIKRTPITTEPGTSQPQTPTEDRRPRERKLGKVGLVSVNQEVSKATVSGASSPSNAPIEEQANVPASPTPPSSPGHAEASRSDTPDNKGGAAPRRVILNNNTLMEAWLSYADNRLPKAQIRRQNLLRNRKLLYEGDTHFTIDAISQVQKTELEELIPDILSFMQQALGVAELTVEVKLTAPSEKKAIRSNTEWLQQEQEQNSALKSLFSTLDLREV